MTRALQAQVNEADALRFLGHRGQALGAGLEDAVERIAAQVNGLQPCGIWRTFAIEQISADGEEAGVQLAGTLFFLPGSHIARHLRDAQEAVLLAVTLGAESERLLKRSTCISSTDGLIADACASSLVEEAANSASRLITEEASARGLHAGRRFSPGYGNFPLSAQRDFLRAIDAEKLLGIRLTEGDLMVPTKSITAVIPLTKERIGSSSAMTEEVSG